MLDAISRIRSALARRGRRHDPPQQDAHAEACSWDALRAVYEEQAARGVPEAIRGLELIEHDR